MFRTHNEQTIAWSWGTPVTLTTDSLIIIIPTASHSLHHFTSILSTIDILLGTYPRLRMWHNDDRLIGSIEARLWVSVCFAMTYGTLRHYVSARANGNSIITTELVLSFPALPLVIQSVRRLLEWHVPDIASAIAGPIWVHIGWELNDCLEAGVISSLDICLEQHHFLVLGLLLNNLVFLPYELHKQLLGRLAYRHLVEYL